mmetsp:Transcript_25553/g.38730  ORF Transcript_25553/g.38730 Transcript_25553/m.38730 type:complete len:391 (+) Transcript_25553:135-1307(+)
MCAFSSNTLGGRRYRGSVAFFLVLIYFLLGSVESTIHAGGLNFESIPAMFGTGFDEGMQYQAYLQYMPTHPYLCNMHDNSTIGASYENVQSSVDTYIQGNQTRKETLPVALLVRRGICSFEDKALIAMALRIKPRFVIVYNDRSQSDLVHMGSSNRYDIDIHMVFVSYTTGLKLRQMLREHETNSTITNGVIVTLDGQFPGYFSAYNEANEIQQWVLTVSSVFFAFLTSLGCLLICLQAGYFPMNSQFAFALHKGRMTEEQVLKFPTIKYGVGEGNTKQASCPICIEEFQVGETLRQMPCHHQFHTECIVPWLDRHSVCPMCKVELSDFTEETSLVTPWSQSLLITTIISRLVGRTLVSNEDPDEIEDTSETEALSENSDNLQSTENEDV